MQLLKFSPANSKTEGLLQVPELAEYLTGKRKVYSLDLASGYSCPFAEKCLSKAKLDKATGKRKIWDGPKTEFRCFSASQEAQYTNVYNLRWHNFNLLKACKTPASMLKLIKDSLPKNAGIVRPGVGGDLFSQVYFNTWYTIAALNPDKLFYAYTKSLPYWIKIKPELDNLPNLVLTASRGGRRDDLIEKYGLREAVVVFSEQEAIDKGLEIDHDDSHAANPSKKHESFALLIHGSQPAGSPAAKAKQALNGKGSYSRKKGV